MPSKTNPQHHVLKRRKRRRKQKRKHKNRTRQTVDIFAYFFSIFVPIMTLPQVYQVWSNKDASGLSAVTWSVYLVSAFFWLLYGFVHREIQIMIVNFLYIILNTAIVFGIFLYS